MQTSIRRRIKNSDTFVGYRVSGDGDHRRDVRDVPAQEIANAIYTVLYEQVSMGQDDLLRETANKLGYTRLGNNVLSALAMGIHYMPSPMMIGVFQNAQIYGEPIQGGCILASRTEVTCWIGRLWNL